MGESETIRGLLQLLDRLKEERKDLKSCLHEILNKIAEGRFFSSDSIHTASQSMLQIERTEADLREGCAALYPEKVISDSIEELQKALDEAERNSSYKNAAALFLRLRLPDEEENRMLSVHKENLRKLGQLQTLEEYKNLAEKYLDFISAYQETNPLQLVKYTQKLQGQFEDELISWAIFKKEEILQEEILQEEILPEEILQGKILPEELGIVQEEEAKETQTSENIQTAQRPEKESAELEQEAKEKIAAEEEHCYQIMKEEGALRECKGRLEVCCSPKKEKKKFSAKEFKGDISGPMEELRKKILTDADSYSGVTLDYLEAVVENSENGLILRECETLLNMGYLRKHIISGMGDLYLLSPRGCKAFLTKASAAFLGVGIKTTKKTVENEENASVIKLLLFSVICYEFENNEMKDMIMEHCAEEYFFISKGKNNKEEEGAGIIYTAIVTEKKGIGSYFTKLKKELEKEEYKELVVTGMNLEHAFQTVRAIHRILGEKLLTDRIYCYSFEEKEKRAFQEGSLSEKQAAVTQEEYTEQITKEETEDEADQAVQINKNYKKMLCADKIYCATAYLRAALEYHNEFAPLYHKLAYAVNDPMEKCSYTSDKILNLYFDLYYKENSLSHEYFMASALLRNYFNDHIGYDYHMQQLYDAAKGSSVFLNNSELAKAAYELLDFKKDLYSGIDKYAAYRSQDNIAWEAELVKIKKLAQSYYNAYILNKSVEYASHKRFLETRRIIFSPDGEMGMCLKVVSENDRELLPIVKEYLQKNFIKDKNIDAVNIEGEKIDEIMDKSWIEAAHHMRLVKKTSDLMSSLRMNLYKQILKVVTVMCDWVALYENRGIEENDKGLAKYKITAGSLIGHISAAAELEQENIKKNPEAGIGGRVLLYTLKELKEKLDGSYQGQGKYFYAGFLKNDKVLLDTDFLPDMEYQISDLPEFSLTNRIAGHTFEKEKDMKERLKEIFDGGDDYGTASLIIEYLKETDTANIEEIDKYSISDAIEYAKKDAVRKKDEFVENLELAQSYGQLENSSEDKKEKMLQGVSEWYERTRATNNFGFFSKLLLAYQTKIKEEAREREVSIRRELEAYLRLHEQKAEETDRIEKIRRMLAQQNYTVAEDLMNRLINDETESELELLKTDYLQEFIDSYDYNYKSVSDSGKTLRSMYNTARAKKDTKGGQRLLDSWMTNGGHLGEQKLANFLENLGFSIEQVKEQKILNKLESYLVTLKKPENGRKSNYKHPMAAFGSKATEDGFRVVCLYGKYDSLRLIDMFKEIGNARHTIILLDYALSLSDRRELARKVKMEVPEKIFGVIDRVLLMYLVNNYIETSINRMLMAVMMPYTYYQPYVTDSANVMPPELFIGRKEELDKIESPSGVNIVYGGRQLGKSALLSMAKNDINEDENKDRAVLVDIKGLNYEEAARKVSNALSDEGIFLEDYETEDWSRLARKIKQRLQNNTNKIPYLLLLLDEADAFIESCEKVNYQPFDALKEVQSIGTDRFKFVVAGLRNIIRFKRDIALGNNSVLTHLDSVTVTPFNVMEAKELLQLPLFYLGFRFPEKEDALVSMILASTNYFPGLLQMYCAKLLEAMKKSDYAGYNESETPPYIIQEKHIKKVLSEAGFQKSIREKFMITLKVDEDDYYYVIALLMAYLYHTKRDKNGYNPEHIKKLGEEFHLEKLQELTLEKTEALMEEMRELNVLRITAENRYLFTRYSFFQMMGTVQQIEEEILNYMEVQHG